MISERLRRILLLFLVVMSVSGSKGQNLSAPTHNLEPEMVVSRACEIVPVVQPTAEVSPNIEPQDIDTISVAMVGDLMPGTTYPDNRLPKEGGRLLFRNCDSLLKVADIALGNLEGTICEGGKSTKDGMTNGYSFRIPPSMAAIFPEAGLSYLNLANNHSCDFGSYGYDMTMHLLDSLQMPYSGIKGCDTYVILECKGKRIGICSFGQNSYCYRHTVDTLMCDAIMRELRPLCDIMIVSIHGGAEGAAAAHLPNGPEIFLDEKRGNLREFTHHCIDLGADLIWGHGPHVPRAMEVYKGRLIAYSLGNFCTPFGINLKGMCGHAPLLSVRLAGDGRFIDGQIHSFQQVYGDGPQPDPTHAAARDIRQLTQDDIRDSRLDISDDGIISLSNP